METVQDRETRAVIVARLIDRDGLVCQHPDCMKQLDTAAEGPLQITIDHWYPQSWAFGQGWSYEEVWDLSNLKLMHKKCNAKKGDLLPREDGTLPEKKTRTFKYRRDKRAQRADICTACNAGRYLSDGEWCNACGCGPNPGRYPKWRQMPVKECDHDLFYCVSCTIWFPETRRSALDTLLSGGEGYE